MARFLQTFRRILGGLVFFSLLLYVSGVLTKIAFFDLSLLSRIQLFPALFAGSFGVVAFIVLFTLLCGRWYCSCVCPLGVVQDGINRCMTRKSGRKTLKAGKAWRWIRYTILLLCLAVYLFNTTIVLLLVDPWSVFGRLATTFVLPVVTFINNLLASVLNVFGNYTLVAKGYHLAGTSVLLVALLTLLLLIFLLRRFHGRMWCNTVCPVGTLLHLLAARSPVRIRIDDTRCTKCKQCEKSCKAAVIDIDNGDINTGNCVACFNCLPVCEYDAIRYSYRKE